MIQIIGRLIHLSINMHLLHLLWLALMFTVALPSEQNVEQIGADGI